MRVRRYKTQPFSCLSYQERCLRSRRRGSVSVLADFVDLIPQGHKIAKGLGFVLGLAEQGGGVKGAHEPDAALLNESAVLLRH